MRKILLNEKIIDIFIEYKSQGVSNFRIAGIIGVHPNTLSNWINEGKKIDLEINKNEEAYQSIFDKDELVLGIKKEVLHRLYSENERQHTILPVQLQK
ncbi:MAG: hypothetical protein ACRCV0_06930 [Brevinema sp.]